MPLIEHLHEYGVTCTYTESRRLKTYDAAASKQLVKLEDTDGLIQAVCDNFDPNLSTQNELKQTFFGNNFHSEWQRYNEKKTYT